MLPVIPPSQVYGKRVFLKILTVEDAPRLLEIIRENRDVFRPVDPPYPDNHFTLAGQTTELRDLMSRFESGSVYSFGIFTSDAEKLIGRITLRNIVRGALQSCNVGYYLDAAFHNQGFMTEACGLSVAYSFAYLNLHRVEAAVLPTNAASIKVLEKCGFIRQGLAYRYLFINGEWRDHLLYARINEAVEPS